MSQVGKIARRSFLIGSAVIAGGVAFGVYQTRKPAPNPLTTVPGQTALNPFVLIDGSGITLIAPRAEMGQGVRTTWAALIAEELDVTLDQVRVLHGPAAKAYYNSALIGESLPTRSYETSDFMHALGQALGQAGKLINAQVTGGSTSMKDGFVRMRVAGATARETLKQAAANRLNVAVDTLGTQDGHVLTADGTRLSYPDLAAEAAQIEPPKVTLRDPSQWRLLGRSQPRVDMIEKATGTATFGIDVRLPGLKFAALRINPHLGGPMLGFDASAARDLAGVDDIIDLGTGVAVVANNTWIAMQALDRITFDWGPAPQVIDTRTQFDRIEEAFQDRPNSTLRDDGAADKLPAGATEVTAEYRVPYLAHATMEPMNATAHFTGDRLTVWCGTQTPTLMQWRCADAAGLDTDAVDIHTTYLGGGFGRRGEFDFGVYATRIAVALKGTPVQLTWSREEDMTHDFYRPGAIARFRGGVAEGKAVLMDGRMAAQSVIFESIERALGLPGMGPDKVHVEGLFNQPYAIENYRVRGHIAAPSVPVGSWRAVGNSHNGFFHDTFLDEMAHAAGRDPLEFRLDLMRDTHTPSARTLEAVRDTSDWSATTPDGVGRGVGFTYSFGTPVAQVIEVVQDTQGIRIARAWIACDVGVALDPATIEAQMIGGMIYGLSAACFEEITFTDGQVEQGNFPDYEALRMHTTPVTQVRILETNRHIGGVGEPGTPPSMPALGNALFDLTGIRARSLPFNKTFDLMI